MQPSAASPDRMHAPGRGECLAPRKPQLSFWDPPPGTWVMATVPICAHKVSLPEGQIAIVPLLSVIDSDVASACVEEKMFADENWCTSAFRPARRRRLRGEPLQGL